jgi:hypothetical protein
MVLASPKALVNESLGLAYWDNEELKRPSTLISVREDFVPNENSCSFLVQCTGSYLRHQKILCVSHPKH